MARIFIINFLILLIKFNCKIKVAKSNTISGKLCVIAILLSLLFLSCTFGVEKKPSDNNIDDIGHGFLKISENKHFLEFEDGTEFFFMGDTAYHIPSLDRSEVVTYVKDRVNKKFNVILVTANNFMYPNFEAESPFQGTPPFTSFSENEKYWGHIDYIVNKADEYNLFVVLISAWGFELNTSVWTDPYNHVYQYGQFIGNRYKDKKNVIFCAAGEFETIMGSYTPLTDSIREGWLRRIGEGIRNKCNSKQLMEKVYS